MGRSRSACLIPENLNETRDLALKGKVLRSHHRRAPREGGGVISQRGRPVTFPWGGGDTSVGV